MKVIGKLIGLSFVGLALTLSGCAGPQQVKERYFWPPAPDEPRIEWLGTYQSESNLKSSAGLWQAVVGDPDTYMLDMPVHIGSNGADKVFVADIKLGTFLVFDFKEKKVHPLGRENTSNLFEQPSGVAVDGDGSIYAADQALRKIFVFNSDESPKGVLDLAAFVKSIGAIAVDKIRKRVIVPDIKGHKIAAFDFSGKLVWSVGKRGTGGDEFNYPTSVAVDKEGNIVVCDSMNARIVRLTPDGKPLSTFGSRGDGPASFAQIKAVAVDSSGHIYVTDGKSNRVSIFNDKGEVLMNLGGYYKLSGGVVTPGGFYLPHGIYIDGKDTIYVVDQYNARFQVFQYMDKQYLADHPITADAPVAKPPQAPAGAAPAGVKK